MKKVVSVLAASLALAGVAQAEEHTFENFDFEWGQSSENWDLVAEGDKCGWATATEARLCGEELMMHMYTRRNPASPGGFLRHGFMHTVDNGEFGKALALTYTSGEVRVEGTKYETEYQGTKITSYQDYVSMLPNLDVSDFGLDPMPGEPQIYIQAHSGPAPETPLFDAPANRFNIYIWYPASDQRHWQFKKGESRSPKKTLSWYPFIDTARSGHYYHHTTNRAYGSWVKVQFDGHPSHANHGELPDTGWYTEGGMVTDSGTEYFERMASFSFRFHEMGGSASPYTLQTDRWTYEHVSNENEETIANVGVGYDPERREFDISLEDKYRCRGCEAKYQVKYSFSPFTQRSFESSNNLVKVKNYYLEDNQDEHVIVKPNPGYNQVWAKMVLPEDAVKRYLNGETLYFAVQDISERNFETEAGDHKIVTTDAGDREQWKLIKSIDIDYMPAPKTMQLTAPKKVATPYNYVNVAVGRQSIADIHETKPEDGWSDVRDASPSASTLIGAVRGDSAYTVDLKGLDQGYRVAAAKRVRIEPVIDPCGKAGCGSPKRDLTATAHKEDAPMVALDLMWDATSVTNIDMPIQDGDYLAITVRNDSNKHKRINPHVLFHATGVKHLKNADNLHNLGYDRIYANGYDRTWYYPLSTQDSPSLHELTIMMPYGNDELTITDIQIVR